MDALKYIGKLIKNNIGGSEQDLDLDKYPFEYCTKCDANLTLQKGYSNELPYWSCKGCGTLLINPEFDTDDDILWFCDGCETLLNTQDGFTTDCGDWKCAACGFVNKIDPSEIYLSEDEYQSSLNNPYKGLSDEEVLELSDYDEIGIGGRPDIILIENRDNHKLYVKKILVNYDLSVYKYLLNNPIDFMPRLIAVYEGQNNLVIIEEYIKGKTIAQILEEKCFEYSDAINVAIKLCDILLDLHGQDKAIIHRDIKPSNVIITDDGDVYLLDINVAKWYKPDELEDTKMFGTMYFAAPEQFGYGFSASSVKSDIYSLGILLNVMLTGKLPKEERATGKIWHIIEKCISLEPEKRYCASELKNALESL